MSFGTDLKSWRNTRRFSQLALASEAGVSQRHLSFLETGRARPSREMVLHLSRVLDIPLRGRNDLLLSAGMAPEYSTRGLDDATMTAVRSSLEFILERHEPHPAVLVDRLWNLLMTNEAASRLTPLLIDPATAPVGEGPPNLALLTLHPDGLRRSLENFDEVAHAFVDRLAREAAARPGDEELNDLLEQVLRFEGIPDPRTTPPPSPGHALLIPLHYKTDRLELRLFTTIAVIGTPRDATLEELRLETFFPADDRSAVVLRDLAAGRV